MVFEKTAQTGGFRGKITKSGEQLKLPADTVIIAIGQLPDQRILAGSPYKSMLELPKTVVLAGDIAEEKKDIATAIASGTAAAAKIMKIIDE